MKMFVFFYSMHNFISVVNSLFQYLSASEFGHNAWIYANKIKEKKQLI